MRMVSQHRNVVFVVFIPDLVTQLVCVCVCVCGGGGGGGGGSTLYSAIVAYTGRLHPKGVPFSGI